MLAPEEAVSIVESKFPVRDYFTEDRAAWLTVGNIVEKYLSEGARLFDFGAGACDKTAVAQVMGCECSAFDDLQDNWYLRGNNIEKIEAFAESMGIDFTRTFRPVEEGEFDVVMLNDVLEHIHDSPREILSELVRGLVPGGKLIVTVPNLANIRKRIDLMRGRTNLANYDLYYWYRGPWRGPQREYVRADLVSMCENLDLNILELTSVHHMLGNLRASLHPIYKAATAVFPGWRDTWLLVAEKPSGWTPRSEMADEDYVRIYGQTSRDSLYK